MAEGFKFIHASDLHLDRPMQGLTELPAPLKPALVEAACLAAKKIFDLAINERVDFILLSGGLFDHRRTAPRSRAFLLNQFERLAERKIKVYWSAAEAADWPAKSELPDNVFRFSSPSIEVLTHEKNGQALASIHGACSDLPPCSFSDFSADPAAPFAVALTAGEFPTGEIKSSHIRYWALGGRSMTYRRETEYGVIAYPGTPQGRCMEETGHRGCLLGHVSSIGELKMEVVETSAIRWLQQKITVPEEVTDERLKNIFLDRAIAIANEPSQCNTMVEWHLLTTGTIHQDLRQQERQEHLVDWLRTEFGEGQETWLWTTDLRVEPPDFLPQAWCEEDTILGEYLRAIETHQGNSNPLSLDAYLPDSLPSGMTELRTIRPEQVAEIFRHAVLLGVDCMGPSTGPAGRGVNVVKSSSTDH